MLFHYQIIFLNLDVQLHKRYFSHIVSVTSFQVHWYSSLCSRKFFIILFIVHDIIGFKHNNRIEYAEH